LISVHTKTSIMKRAILTILIKSIFCLVIFAQNARVLSDLYPSVDPKNEWKVLVSPHWPEPLRQMRIFSYSEEEHLINDQLYRNLQYRQEGTETIVSTGKYARQDGPRVWVTLGGLENNEYLIADYTQNVGDTLLYEEEYTFILYPVRVYSKDTVVMMDGSERLRFYYYCDDKSGESNFIRTPSIQGVLNVATIHQELYHCSLADDLNAGLIICYYENGELIYSNPMYEECLINQITSITDSDDYHVFPNPGGDEINIQVKNHVGRFLYSIYSTSGSLISEGTFDSSEIINTSTLSPGMYFIVIRGKGGSKTIKWVRN